MTKPNWQLPDSEEDLIRIFDNPDWSETLSAEDSALLWTAYQFAYKAHGNQTRSSGEPYVTHVVAVAKILTKYKLDLEAVIAALLHDTVEDTAVTLEDIEENFGNKVAELVDGVSKLEEYSQKRQSKKSQDAANIRKLITAMVEDVRVVLIKLADRLHNIRTLGVLSEERKKRIARETLDIYAPLAERLGIWEIRTELEDESFKHLQPKEYKDIAQQLKHLKIEHETILNEVMKTIREKMVEMHLPVDEYIIAGRPKHIYSIYKKLKQPKYQGQGIDRIYDKLGIRVIVNTVEECYLVLGIIHAVLTPVPGEFDDYIGFQLPSGYQSLHTAVRYSPLKRDVIEIQIRTHEMHHEAEFGIAAHWLYKEEIKQDLVLQHKVTWLRQMIEELSQAEDTETEDAETFVDSLKSDILKDRVFVLTPRGEVIDLPHGSTPIDFAYRIHTEVGHKCRGAKVNDVLVGLDYQLGNGDKVEILTAKSGGPSRDWLNENLSYVVTNRARKKIKYWFKRQNYNESVTQGRSMLERELKRLTISDKIKIDTLAVEYGYKSAEAFLAAVGYHDISIHSIVRKINELDSEHSLKIIDEDEATYVHQSTPVPTDGVFIRGVGDLLHTFAHCCRPVPGDPIIGYITRGRGVTIHRKDCLNVLRLKDTERLINVTWGSKEIHTFPVDILIRAYDRPGLMRDVSDVIANEHINMTDLKVGVNPKKLSADLWATIEVTDVDQLQRVMDRIRNLPNIIDVYKRR